MSLFMLLVVVFTATPKVYFHQLLGHTHLNQKQEPGKGTEYNEDKNTQDCDLDKFEAPVYFTVFKFIFSWNPFKSPSKVSVKNKEQKVVASSVIITQLRAPPFV